MTSIDLSPPTYGEWTHQGGTVHLGGGRSRRDDAFAARCSLRGCGDGEGWSRGTTAGSAVESGKRGKGTKWMVLVDGQGLPLGVRLESASPSEVTLAEATLAEVRVPRRKGRPRQKPERIIADRGYDSDPLRQRLKKQGIDLIAPYRKNNQQRRYEDGRKLRRYVRRWIVERTNAWLGQFRRLLVRHEHLLSTYCAFFYLACLWIDRKSTRLNS